MIGPSETGTFNPLGWKSCVYSATRMHMLSKIFLVQSIDPLGWARSIYLVCCKMKRVEK